MFEIRVCSERESLSLAQSWSSHIISIIDPERSSPHGPAQNVLVLQFEDTERPSSQAPASEHVAAGLAFALRLTPADRLLVHCVAGLSRSVALATAIMVQHGLEAEAALARVAAMRPDMWPNERICRLADDLLHTGGTIVAAVRAWQLQQIEEFEKSNSLSKS
jgi:predicted protein tyrosine phosphatase